MTITPETENSESDQLPWIMVLVVGYILFSIIVLHGSLCVRAEEKLYYTSEEFERERPSFRELQYMGTYSTLVDTCETQPVCHVSQVKAENYADFCLPKCTQGKHYCVGVENGTKHFCGVLREPDKRHRYVVVQETPGTISVYLLPCEDGYFQKPLQNRVEKCVRDPSVHVYRSSTSTSPGLAFCRTEIKYCNALRKLTFKLGSDDDRCVPASEECSVQGLDLLPNCSCASPCPVAMSRNVSSGFECMNIPSSKRQNVADGDTNISMSEKPETVSSGTHPDLTGGTNLEPVRDIDRSNGVNTKQPTDIQKVLEEDKEDNLNKDKGTAGENIPVIIVGVLLSVVLVVTLIVVLIICTMTSLLNNSQNTGTQATTEKVTEVTKNKIVNNTTVNTLYIEQKVSEDSSQDSRPEPTEHDETTSIQISDDDNSDVSEPLMDNLKEYQKQLQTTCPDTGSQTQLLKYR